MSPSDLAQAALAYAERGWPVLPLAPRSKIPLTSHGLLDASTDSDVIEAWWYARPDANIGLRTGIIFDVLDIDGPEGVDSLMMDASVQGMSDSPVSETGKGWHYLFQTTGARNAAGIWNKVDFRGQNGYIVAPPSVHPLGHPYRWRRGPEFALPQAPDWLLAKLTFPAEAKPLSFFKTKDGKVIPLANSPIDLDIVGVATSMGLNPKRRNGYWVVSCIFHEDSTPSLALYTPNPPERHNFYCYGCHAWGNALDLRDRKPAGYR